MDYFKSLPLDIAVDILTRLPVDSVLECKSVCKTWRNLVCRPSFSKMHLHHHLNHPSSSSTAEDSSCKLGFLALTSKHIVNKSFYYFEYNEKNIDDDEKSKTSIQRIKRIKFTSPLGMDSMGGSCNGLVCVIDHSNRWFCIFNPITREYVILPKIETDCHVYQYNFGFGYVSSTNEYKVLVISTKHTDVEVHLYTIGSRSGWRNLGNFDFQVYGGESGVFFEESLYWMDGNSRRIITFDLAEDKFCEHLSPPPLPPGNIWYQNWLGVLNGHLCFGLYEETDAEEDFGFDDIWVLEKTNCNHGKEEGEEHQSLGWRKEFKIDTMLLLAITKSGGVLTYGGMHYINICNTKTSTEKSLVKFKNQIHQVFHHENTLVSLKELGEEDTKIMEPAEETKCRELLQEDANPEYIYL